MYFALFVLSGVIIVNPDCYYLIKRYVINLFDFLLFMHKNNPLLALCDDDNIAIMSDDEKPLDKPFSPAPKLNYADKYMDAFNRMSNNYDAGWTDIELKAEADKKDELMRTYAAEYAKNHRYLTSRLNMLRTRLTMSQPEIIRCYMATDDDYDSDHDEYSDDVLETIYSTRVDDFVKNINSDIDKCIVDMDALVCKNEEDCIAEARIFAVDLRLDKLVSNIVLEHTPLGCVIMRYSNARKTFEYYSNHTIPYRFLETVARKYVITFFCKSVYIVMSEELLNGKPVVLNGGAKINARRQLPSNNKRMEQPMPPQIKAGVVSITDSNTSANSRMLKENANRYTHEGQIGDFCIIKKTDKRITNKRLSISFADFKKNSQHNKIKL